MDIFQVKNVFHLFGEIIPGDNLKVNKLFSQEGFSENNNKFSLTTPGGSIIEASKIMLQIMEYPLLTVEATKHVHSAGMIIYLGFNTRYAKKDTRFLFHNPVFKNFSKAADTKKQQIQNFFSERTGCDLNKINLLMKNNQTLSAEECVQLGFVHKIV